MQIPKILCMEKLQFETLKFLFAGMGTLGILPENLELKFVFKVLGNLRSQIPKKWISSQNFDLIPMYGIGLMISTSK